MSRILARAFSLRLLSRWILIASACFVVAILGARVADAQSISVDRNQIIGGSTQTFTVTFDCGPYTVSGDGCGPGWDPNVLNAVCQIDNSCGTATASGSYPVYAPYWVWCFNFNPATCAPFQASVGLYARGNLVAPAIPVYVYPNQITITTNSTQFEAYSQPISYQITLQAPTRNQANLAAYLTNPNNSGGATVGEDSGWNNSNVTLAAGQTTASINAGGFTLPSNYTATGNYTYVAFYGCGLAPGSSSTSYNCTSSGACCIYNASNEVPLTVYPQTDPGPCQECEGTAGAPINVSTGDVWITKTDYSVPGLSGGLSVSRTWNSLWNQSTPIFSAGMFGSGWTSDFEERLQTLDGTHVKYWRSSGNTWTFDMTTGAVIAPPNQHGILIYNSGTTLYTLTFPDGATKTFRSSGYLTAVKDRNGNQTSVTYDGSNRITKLTSAGGQSISFTFGNSMYPNLATIAQDSVGTAATYTYSGNNLSQVAYADASQLNYAFDVGNNITSVTDGQGKVIETHTYDSSGRGLTSSRANSVDSITIQYPSSSTTTLTDSSSNATTYTYSGIGGSNYMTGISGPGCDSCGGRNTQSFSLDTSGNRLSTTDANGVPISYTYDSNGNMLTKTDAVGTWTYTYNGFAEVLTAKDPLGNTTTNVYDSKGNLTSTTTPSPDGGSTPGSKTSFTYDTRGELTQITDPLGHSTTLTYFSTGLINTVKDAQKNVTTYGYDGRGNRTSVKDALSNTTTFTYDSMNRLKKITHPGNSTTQFAYDTRGRHTSVADANNKTTTYGYDDSNRLTQITDPVNNITTYAYDTESNLTGITDALTRNTSFTYDALGRVTKTTFPSYFFETYGYDNVGNLTSKTDRNGKTVTYTYDQLNRLHAKYYPDSTSVSYTYDNDSQLTQVQDPTGTYQLTYDNMGRLKQATTNYAFLTGKTFTDAYAYDAASNRTSLTDPENGSTSYSYDSLNRLTTLAPPSAFGSGSFGLSYDALSRRTQLTRPNSISTSYAYDSLSRLLSLTHAKHSTTLDGASYTVDAVGNRTSRTPLPGSTATNYSYDGIYELLTATQGSTTQESYSYDVVGNRLSSLGVSPYSYNTSNELTAKPGVTYTYDNNGNTLTKTDSTGTTTYAWDFENRLTSITLPGSGGTVSFKYDPLGRRIHKSSSGSTSIYAYDADNLIEETSGAGAVVARYTQGLSIDEPLAELRSPTTSYYEADGLGSLTSLSNSSGAIANTYTYDSFGNLTASTGTVVNPFRYTGREFDSETGLYYYRARYYDPNAGHFLSEDPIRLGGGINFYAYVDGSPINGSDPLGLWNKDTHDKLFWNALEPCGVDHETIYKLQKASADFDAKLENQMPGEAYKHGMEAPWQQTVEGTIEAIFARDTFIKSSVGEAIGNYDLGGDWTTPLAQAMHTLQDMTSPVHMKNGLPLPWPTFPNGLRHGDERGSQATWVNMTPEIMQRNTAVIRNLYGYVTGQRPDRGCN